MPERGEVRAVAWMPQGSELTVDVAIGGTVLPLGNTVDFDEDGGTLDIDGTTYDYDTADHDALTVTLDVPLTTAVVTGDRVNVVSGGAVAVDYIAFVSLGDGDEVEVSIPFAQRDLWPEGEYDDPVVVDLTDDLETIAAVPGRTPTRDGSFIDPDTLPPSPPPGPDGLPPSSSPTPEVIGGIGALFVRWVPIVNTDPVTYEVHLSTTPAGVSLGDATTVAHTSGSSATLRALADGSTVVTGIPYYVTVIAFDADGPAGASPAVQGTPMLITGPDISANTITGNNIVGGTITGDLFAATTILAGEIVTGLVGQRVRISTEGIQVFAPDGSIMVDLPSVEFDPANPDVLRHPTLRGNAELEAATTGALTLTGNGSQIANAASLQLAAGVQSSNTPLAAAMDWPATVYQNPQLANVRGWARSDVNGQEATVQAFFDASRLNVLFGGVWESYPMEPFIPVGIVHHYSGNGWVVVGNISGSSTNTWQARRYRINRTGAPFLEEVSRSPVGAAFWAGPVNPWSETTVGMQMNDTQTFYLATMVWAGAPNGQVQVRKYRQTDWSLVNAPLLSQFPANAAADVLSLGPVYYGAHDGAGGNLYYVPHYDTVYAFSSAAGGPRQPDYDFPLAQVGGPLQVTAYKQTATDTYAFEEWRQLSTDLSVVNHYSTANMWTAANDRYWWAAAAWWNSVNGRHTTLGAKTLVTMRKRTRLVLTSTAIPTGDPTEDPDSVRFFVGKGTATVPPANSAMWWQTDPDPTDTTIRISAALFSGSSAAAIAPTNTFPTAMGGVLKGQGLRLDLTPKVSIAGRGDANLDGLIPPGSMMMSAATTNPPGWLLCDGSSQSRAAFPDLFAAIGTTFGAGTDSPVGTTFSLPDMSRRIPFGTGVGIVLGQGDAQPAASRTMGHTHDFSNAVIPTNTTATGGTNRMSGGGTTGSSLPMTGASAWPHLSLNFIIKV